MDEYGFTIRATEYSATVTLACRGLYARWSDISVATRVVSRERRASSGVAGVVYAVMKARLIFQFIYPLVEFSFEPLDLFQFLK